jgi:hypothetical protein
VRAVIGDGLAEKEKATQSKEGEMSDYAYCAVALKARPRIETRYTDEKTILQDFDCSTFQK